MLFQSPNGEGNGQQTSPNGGSKTPKECRGDYVMKLAISSPGTIMRANAVECCASFLAHLGRFTVDRSNVMGFDEPAILFCLGVHTIKNHLIQLQKYPQTAVFKRQWFESSNDWPVSITRHVALIEKHCTNRQERHWAWFLQYEIANYLFVRAELGVARMVTRLNSQLIDCLYFLDRIKRTGP